MKDITIIPSYIQSRVFFDLGILHSQLTEPTPAVAVVVYWVIVRTRMPPGSSLLMRMQSSLARLPRLRLRIPNDCARIREDPWLPSAEPQRKTQHAVAPRRVHNESSLLVSDDCSSYRRHSSHVQYVISPKIRCYIFKFSVKRK